MQRAYFLDFRHFVVRSAGLAILPVSLLLVCALCGSCGPAGKTDPQAVEDSQTSGRISVTVTPELRPLVEREIAAFRLLYPQSNITVVEGSTRDAVGSLLSQQTDLAIVGRELEPEERSVKVKGGMELEGYRFARDGMIVIVNPSNPVSQLSCEDLRAIFLGQATDWSRFGRGKGVIEPVLQPLESDAGVSFLQQVMGGEAPTVASHPAADDSAVVARVLATPAAIGLVSMRAADRGAKVIPVAPLSGLPARLADAETVYKGEYPLTRFYECYVRSTGPRLANGLITFITSLDGQKLVHEALLVPTAVPVRFVRRSPLLSSH